MADKALTRLYAAHRRGIRAYLNRKLGDATIAEDLTQEAFLRLAEGGSDAVIHGRAWLYRTAHNLAVDYKRQIFRRRTDAVDVESLSGIVDEAPSQEQDVAAREEMDRLRALVEELPERTQQVFVATRIDGLTYSEASERLGISISSVQKHLVRALHHVTQRMKPM